MSIQQHCNNFKCNWFIEKPCITSRLISFLCGQRKFYLRNFRQRQQNPKKPLVLFTKCIYNSSVKMKNQREYKVEKKNNN